MLAWNVENGGAITQFPFAQLATGEVPVSGASGCSRGEMGAARNQSAVLDAFKLKLLKVTLAHIRLVTSARPVVPAASYGRDKGKPQILDMLIP